MASGSSTINASQPQIPVFKGDSYEFWSIKMKTLFKSQDLWDLVDKGITEGSEEAANKEILKKDAKALFFIQQAVDETIFARIAAADSAKAAWNTLKTEYQGSTKVILVKLQSLRRDFETSVMKSNEFVQDYLAKVSSIVGQRRTYGDKITDETVVAKILRSLSPKFDHVVAAIEESRDLSTLTVDELMGSLQAHEARINRNPSREEEHAFQTQGESFKSSGNRGRGRGGFRGRGRGRMSSVQCTYCKKFGHKEENCWSKEKQAQYAEGEEDYLFMTYENHQSASRDVWYIDSACSNHLTGNKEKFKDLDETQKSLVRLGDDKQVQVEGKGTVAVNFHGKERLIRNVRYAPGFVHNLLSVGQLMDSGLIVIFEENACTIKRKTGEVLYQATMTENRMFPIDFSCAEFYGMMSSNCVDTDIWHQRYGHLYVKGLQLLVNKEMVKGLPNIKDLTRVCEGCVFG